MENLAVGIEIYAYSTVSTKQLWKMEVRLVEEPKVAECRVARWYRPQQELAFAFQIVMTWDCSKLVLIIIAASHWRADHCDVGDLYFWATNLPWTKSYGGLWAPGIYISSLRQKNITVAFCSSGFKDFQARFWNRRILVVPVAVQSHSVTRTGMNRLRK